MVTAPRLFDSDLYYHIYNCGVEKRDIFLSERDYLRFMDTCAYYLRDQHISYTHFQELRLEAQQEYVNLNPKGEETLRVKIIAYCLMPNHFHFLLKPAKENGITQFLSDIANSHTRYFNTKNKRVGGLFQGTFKAKQVSSDGSCFQVSRYIHLNPAVSLRTNPYRILRPEHYPYTSYPAWISSSLNPKGYGFLDHQEVERWVALAGGKQAYIEFAESKIGLKADVGTEDSIFDED